MKKVLALILALVLMAGSSTAYAANQGQNGSKSGMDRSETNRHVNNGSAQKHQQRSQAREKMLLVRQNEAEFKQLREEIKNKLLQLKKRITYLKRNPSSLTDEQVVEIREKLSLVRSDKAGLNGTWGLIKKEQKKLKAHNLNRNMDGAIGDLDNICEVQQKRIRTMKQLSSDIDNILRILKDR
ncbi:MAG: hypothetical protein CVU89_01710 [Firmicutes bacterium HGW-Firmicutes-14]|nr:MAG: hypothetical protein CVU89_01710 [Firmicutes bacterium HGW-Firmicutes-14]